MKRSNGIELFKLSIEKVLKKYGKWFLKMCGSPVFQQMLWVDMELASV